MQDEPSFGEWLRRRRKTLDLTQAELAQRVPCATITIQKMEANERRPSKQMAERLAEPLDIPAEERPAFVSFARTGTRVGESMLHSQAAHRLAWSLSPRRLTNLPLPPAPLIGRERDLASIRQRLLGANTRLLTLIGPPGVGKTRLAIQAATSLLDDYGDGVYFVSLAPVDDPSHVAASIAQTLAVNETLDRAFTVRLKEYLRDKHMLLVLDNFEQVVTAAPFVSRLLAECPWLSILVTSRAPLRVRRERQLPVLPLAVPAEVNATPDPAELMRYSAIALFVERARAARPDFCLTTDNAVPVATICARLDGLPLAIELIAARIGVLPPQTLLERLSTQLVLHTDGPRDLSDRHRTLHSAIQWSYALLALEEQSLLARVSVFVGGWTLEAMEGVAWDSHPHSTPTALEPLTSLVNNSLVVQQAHDGEPRFTLLETIRAYALDRLAESGEEEQVRQRHAEYHLALAKEADPHLRTSRQQVWLDRLEAERDNLQAALAWFIERTGDAEAGLRLAGALGHFWNIRSHVSEGRHWSNKALQSGKHASPALRASVLMRAGMFAWPGDLPLASSLVKESIALSRELGPARQWDLAHALTGLGLIMAYQADPDSVQSSCEEALPLFQQIQDKWGMALALSVLGQAYLLRHDYAGACSRFEEGLALFRETGDKWGIGIPLLNWGYTESLQGNADAACVLLEESIAMHRYVGERVMRSLTLNVLAQLVQQQGDYQQAAALYGESLDLYRKMGMEESASDVIHNLAYLAQSQGHHALAAKLYKESLELFTRQGNEEGIAKSRAGLAAVASVPEETETGRAQRDPSD
jgi:predicted ATPase/transcriptional regulator with XRE-family HTH domain